jgi:hypothetical protein
VLSQILPEIGNRSCPNIPNFDFDGIPDPIHQIFDE